VYNIAKKSQLGELFFWGGVGWSIAGNGYISATKFNISA